MARTQPPAPEARADRLRRRIDDDPDDPTLWLNLGRTLLEKGQPSEAARVFAHAIALAEKRGDHRTGREIHVLLKRADAAGTDAG